MSGKYNDSLEFDPKAVHTLPPDKKGEVLKNILPLLSEQIICIILHFFRLLLPAGIVFRDSNCYSFITFLVNTLFFSLRNTIK